MTVRRGPAVDHRVGELTSIANSIEPAFPSASETLRAVAETLEERQRVTETPQEFLMRTLSGDQWRVVAECLRIEKAEVLAARDAEHEREVCRICADHARVEALIERSSLGSAEAKSVRDSVPNDIGIALATAARQMSRAEAAERDLADLRAAIKAVKALLDAAEHEQANSLSRTFTGAPFPTFISAADLRALLPRDDAAGTGGGA